MPRFDRHGNIEATRSDLAENRRFYALQVASRHGKGKPIAVELDGVTLDVGAGTTEHLDLAARGAVLVDTKPAAPESSVEAARCEHPYLQMDECPVCGAR